MRERSFRMLLVATFGAFSGYALLLPVVPLWAVTGGAGEIAAGATNGVFMLVTVLTQLGMPTLLRRMDLRWALGGGAVLIGAPAPLFATSAELWVLLGVSALRGVGFGLLTVSGSALVAELVPASQRGRAAGWYGLAVGLPGVVFLPAGVWLARSLGFPILFWIAGVLPVVAAFSAAGMPTARVRPREAGGVALPSRLLSLWLMMTAVSLAAGGLVAFLPMAVAAAFAPPALLAMGAAVMLGRWLAGVVGDRWDSARVLVPGVLVSGAGMAVVAVAASGPGPLAVVGALALGAGFGATQNATLVAMFERTDSSVASTTWNIAYDAGNGLGAASFGLLVTLVGYPATFAAAATAVLGCLPLALASARAR